MASTEEAPSPLECIRNAYASGLYLLPEDLWAIDFTVATVLASKTHKNTEPPFGCLVGPPASGKTEILRPVLDWVGMTQPFTEATANAFMSGSPTVTKSLLDRLDRRTLVMQDMTALMSRNPTKWDEFFGTIRCAFDGTYAKASGAKEELRKPKMHFTLVGAVTEAIYNYMDKDVDMGQRFLFIRLARTSGRAHRYMQFQKSWAGNNQSAWRDTTRQTVREQLDRVRDEYMTSSIVLNQSQEDDESEQEYQLRVGHMAEEADTGWTRVRLPLVTFPVDMVPVVFALANTVTRVRSAKTDFMKGAEREEGVNRIAKQFHTLASCRAISELRDTASNMDLEFLRVVARDTITPNRLDALKVLYNAGNEPGSPGLTCRETAILSHLPETMMDSLLRHWRFNGFVVETTGGQNQKFKLADDSVEDLEACRILDPVQGPK